MEGAFLGVKQKLVEAVELAHPDPQAPLVLAVDASNTHVGGVLQQADRRGALRPLGFFSAKLDKAQLKYSTFDRELLACFLAIRHFRWCVEGRPLRVLTDHKPLTFALHRVSDAWSARQQRHWGLVHHLHRMARLAEAQSMCEETQQWRERPGTQQVTVGEHVLLCDGSTGALRPVVPGPWRRAVFHSVHDLAHAGMWATRRCSPAGLSGGSVQQTWQPGVGSASSVHVARSHGRRWHRWSQFRCPAPPTPTCTWTWLARCPPPARATPTY